jgi:signal peptidase I
MEGNVEPVSAETVVHTEAEVKAQPESRERGTLAEWIVTALLLLFGTTTVVQAFVIPTPSMENTLLVGDHLLVDKLAYAPSGTASRHLLPYKDIRRGDIIVFRFPGDLSQTYVKRVIGLPGDRIQIKNQEVYVNGRRLNEPYKVHRADYPDPYRDNFPSHPNTRISESAIEMLDHHVQGSEVVVPAAHYFALGDNRDQSSDSRYWGFVPRENIIGKPVLVYWSYETGTDRLAAPGVSWDHLVDVARNFFGKTRWRRTAMLIRGYRLD